MQGTRRLRLHDLDNVRDLGGLITKDGGRTEYGKFLRSEVPLNVCGEDIHTLRAYGVTGSMDLRSTLETENRPSALREAFTYYHCPLFHESFTNGKATNPVPVIRDRKALDWGKLYISMAEQSPDWAVRAMNIAANEPGALLYHCTTGKDRTGIMTCFLLSIAGVSREDIAADYCVSEIYLHDAYLRLIDCGAIKGPSGELLDDPFFRTPYTAILMFIDHMKENYGGVVAFLRSAGVKDETIKTIRRKIVVYD